MRSVLHTLLAACSILYLASCAHHKHVQATGTADAEKKKKPETYEAKKPSASKTTAIEEKYAALLGVDPHSIRNDKLYVFINDWYGVPYKYAGKDKSGIDCSGFSSALYSAVYQKQLSPSAKVQADETKKIDIASLQEGDLVFFDIGTGKISHVGVYLQNNKFVHASTKKGVMINDLNEPYYKKYYVRSGRVK